MKRSSKLFAFATFAFLASLGGCDCGGGATHHGDGGGDFDGGPTDGAHVDHGPDFDGGDVDTGVDMGIDRMAFCMGMGPAVEVGDAVTGTMTCAGSIATRVFNNSMCTCTDANVAGYLRTRSFDSGTGMMDTTAGAPVGIDENYTTGGFADIGGTFVVAGSSGVMFGGYVKVGGDAKFGGNISAIGYINVSRDLWVAGNVTLIGETAVGRDLHQPSGHSFLTFPNVGGSTINTGFTVDPPCDCVDIVDIQGIVDDAAVHNDNADVSLDPHILDPVAGIGRTITLPCGRFYLSGISGLGDITLHLTGRTALFVEGDVDALGVFNINLDPGAELDLFIKGNLASIGAGSYGDRSAPARTRIYVGGTGDVVLVGASGFVGNVYAPHARITAIGATTVYGSLFGGRIDMPGYLDIHYDRAILDVDRSCPPPGMCAMCGGDACTDHTACIGGTCTACMTDADCCAPLVCYPATGTCGPLLI